MFTTYESNDHNCQFLYQQEFGQFEIHFKEKKSLRFLDFWMQAPLIFNWDRIS